MVVAVGDVVEFVEVGVVGSPVLVDAVTAP
jgi:hypothetical protein